MNRTALMLAAFALFAFASLDGDKALADNQDTKTSDSEASSSTTAEDAAKDDGLKALEGGFSIPAADGEASKDKKSGSGMK